MKYNRVFLSALGYELGPQVVTSAELEERLAPAYARLNLHAGQLEAWTGIAERRWWQPDARLSAGATAAARKALSKTVVQTADLGVVIYGGVCRENFEPATACAVADALGVKGGASVYDLSNACLGVLNGMLEVANRIELGQIRAGLVVSCESAREINEIMLARMLEGVAMDEFAEALATFTGGSGAVAMLLTDGSFAGEKGHRLLGAVSQVAPEHHRLCRWGLTPADGTNQAQFMATDSVQVLKYGVQLGRHTWQVFLDAMGWTPAQVNRVICHQVGSGHQDAILASLALPKEKDFTTYRYLGNMGTAALPVTAAIAEERGVLKAGERVGFLGIGSGLTCLMMGLEWRPVNFQHALYPFTGSYRNVNGYKLHVLDEGRGDTVLMLHGNPTWSFYYRDLVLGLRGTHRVIAPDYIGCGLSDKPDEQSYEYTLRRRVDDLAALIEQSDIDGPITLLMHDWGGMIGMAYATRFPERIGRLVLLNTAAFHLPKAKKLPRTLWLCRKTPLGDFFIRDTGLFNSVLARWAVCRPMAQSVREAYLLPYRAPLDRTALLHFVQDIPLEPGDASYDLVSEVQAKLPDFRHTPTLILWGDRDFVFDHHFLAEWQKFLPGAEVHHFPQAGHYVLEDAGNEILPLVEDFFNRNPVHA